MFNKILKILFLTFAFVASIHQIKYLSSSYLDNNKIYVIQNYCSQEEKNCTKVIKIDLRDNSKFTKKYHNLNIHNDEHKDLIKQDFKKINLNKFIDIL